MSPRRIIGLVLIVVGIVALAWGGVFWTDRDTVLDAGPLEVQTEEREGFAVPPILGVIALVGGIALLAIPDRRRV
jgi:drug/metabolite transporter (DMT)-like permease